MNTLEVSDRREWRRWLRNHYKTEPEIWLVYYKKASGKGRIQYNDAVEEALCFGWIDSTVRKIDEHRFAQRFSPRRAGSGYSQANKERIRRLISKHKVIAQVRVAAQPILAERVTVAADILKAIRGNQQAWRNYQHFSESYKRIRVAFIEGARKRPAEFRKRLDYFVRMTAQNKQFGFGGIEKYY